MNTIDLTPLFEAVIMLVFSILTLNIIPAIKARLDDDQEARLATAVHIAVYAAEKLYGAGRGDEKLAYARAYIQEHCGFDMDFARLTGMINAEIKQMELLEMPETEIVVDPAIEVGAEDDLTEDEV